MLNLSSTFFNQILANLNTRVQKFDFQFLVLIENILSGVTTRRCAFLLIGNIDDYYYIVHSLIRWQKCGVENKDDNYLKQK